MISIAEDLEFKLDQKCNKLSVFIYATRTFKEDILLFFNDVSLRKALATEEVRFGMMSGKPKPYRLLS